MRASAVRRPRSRRPAVPQPSQLGQWPCQIKLVPVNAPYFQGAKLLIAADCTAYAYANMHSEFMKGKITLIGCPKLDAVDYTDKLTEIIRGNDIQSVTIVRMEVPCCGGLEHAAREALRASPGNSFRGRSSRSPSMVRFSIADPLLGLCLHAQAEPEPKIFLSMKNMRQ